MHQVEALAEARCLELVLGSGSACSGTHTYLWNKHAEPFLGRAITILVFQ